MFRDTFLMTSTTDDLHVSMIITSCNLIFYI